MSNNDDLFNDKSEDYARARPRYPQQIYKFLAEQCVSHESVWDVASGNGQASLGLTKYFDHIDATEISENQIANAFAHPKINYSIQAAEKTNFKSNSFDLICVAQALHWFDHKKFWPEVKRVLKPDGIFATWGYSWILLDAEFERIFKRFILDIIEPYWADEIQFLWNQYQEITFPFKKIEGPEIELSVNWNLYELFEYVRTWSAVSQCIKKQGSAFIEKAFEEVEKYWGDAEELKDIKMNFFLIVGRNGV